MDGFDYLLHRQLRDGKEYEKLIPETKCDSTYLGDGMTDFSVSEMAKMVKAYFRQMQKVAPLLKKRSLQQTCNAIHDFTYWHFQYKADKEVQNLRSPACSWYVRRDGIDCKSYSIIASCILTNLGIKHYIRRIKQPAMHPDLWTHVYVIVPKDQAATNVATDYYVIDGTIADNKEPLFTEKSDLYMMEHLGLNGAASQGLNGFSLEYFKGMFSSGWSPSCLGGTHDSKDFDATLASMVPWFDNAFRQVNQAIVDNSPGLLAAANRVLVNAQQIKAQSESYSKYNWDSSCSKGATKAYAELGKYYNDIATKAFLAWLQTYFDITVATVNVKRGGFEPDTKFTKTNFNKDTVPAQQIASISLKPGTTDIKGFEMTPYVVEKTNHATFDAYKFMEGLTTTIASFKGGNGSGSGFGTGTQIGIDPVTGKPYSDASPGNSMKLGASGVVGVLLMAAACSALFIKTPDKPATRPATTVATKPKRKTSTKKSR